RRERASGRDLAHVGVMRRARGVVVEADALAAASRPRLELDRVQVLDVHRAPDLEPLGFHPLRVRRLLLGGELPRHVLRNNRVFRHGPCLSRRAAYASTLIFTVRDWLDSAGLACTPSQSAR